VNDKWSLDALLARYELHPEFKEIYVEGEGDIGVYQLFLDEMGRRDVLVYPITSVSIPPDPADQLKLPQLDVDSRRSDVISLALVFETKSPDLEHIVTCIADADTQHILPESFVTRFLLFTDYTSLESYGYRGDFITRMVRIGSPNLKVRGEHVLEEMTGILEILFSFRVANHQLRWGLKWISPEKNFSYQNSKLTFDETTYLKKYLNANGKSCSTAEFRSAVGELRATFRSDHRMQIRGHDFIELLTWYLRKRSYRAFQKFSAEVVRHNLLSQLRTDDLVSEGLCAALLSKYPASDVSS